MTRIYFDISFFYLQINTISLLMNLNKYKWEYTGEIVSLHSVIIFIYFSCTVGQILISLASKKPEEQAKKMLFIANILGIYRLIAIISSIYVIVIILSANDYTNIIMHCILLGL